MMEKQTVRHPFEPVFNDESQILILGSLPSMASRQNSFYYGHPRNRFWRVLADVTNQPVPHSIDEKKILLLSQRIALWDVIAQCEITGSSDATIQKPVVNDVAGLVLQTKIKRIFANGCKAYELYTRFCEQETGLKAICLPSTSPANASFPLDRLLDSWRIIRGDRYE